MAKLNQFVGDPDDLGRCDSPLPTLIKETEILQQSSVEEEASEVIEMVKKQIKSRNPRQVP
jgi:hypothetical protein